jgi:hypothetical protein
MYVFMVHMIRMYLHNLKGKSYTLKTPMSTVRLSRTTKQLATTSGNDHRARAGSLYG